MPLFKIGQTVYNGKPQSVYLMQGSATRDAEDKPVNGRDHAVVGVAAAQDSAGNTVYVNLNGWRGSYPHVLAVRKGDSILAVGTLKQREYNGRTYYDLDADFVAKSGAGFSDAGFGGGGGDGAPAPEFYEEEDDGQLPF